MGMKAKITLLALLVATVAGAIAFDKLHGKAAPAGDTIAPPKAAAPPKPVVADRPSPHDGMTPVTVIVARAKPKPPEGPVHFDPIPLPSAETRRPVEQPAASAPRGEGVPSMANWGPEEEHGAAAAAKTQEPPKPSENRTEPPVTFVNRPEPSKSASPPLDERDIVRPPDSGSPRTPTPPPSAPPAPPIPRASAPPAPDTYEIEPGDSLYVISQKVYGTPKHWKAIFEANKDTLEDETRLVVGKKLHIPKLAVEPTRPTPPTAEVHAPLPVDLAGKKTHTVKPGDSLTAISKLYYQNGKYWKRIAEANAKTLRDPHSLKVGEVLVIPPIEDVAGPQAGTPTAFGPHAGPTPAAGMPPVPPSPSETDGKKVHVVAQGDNLSSISQKYFGSTKRWKAIFEANRKTLATPDDLVVGAKLVIPDAPTEATPPAGPAGTPPSATHEGGGPAPTRTAGLPPELAGKGTPYTVQEGDTLEEIAAKTLGHGSDWKRIYDLNKGVTMKDADHLSVGQVIAIPAKEDAPAPHDAPPAPAPPRSPFSFERPPSSPMPAVTRTMPEAKKEPALRRAPADLPRDTPKEGKKSDGAGDHMGIE